MKFNRLFLTVFLILFLNTQLKSEEAKVDVIDLLNLGQQFENTKIMLTSIKKTNSILKASIAKIEAECCDKDFSKKEEAADIKSIMQDCLDTNCGKNMFPIVNKKKPPAKLIALKLIDKVDDLILENQNFRYEQLSKKLDLIHTKKIENDENLNELEKENIKLKDTVDKMLKNYQNKITKLEEENKKLTIKYEEAFNMLPPFKQKKLKEMAKD